ncbi:MAG: cytochrome c3 family protein [Gammaproteobacteria bacterium]
MRVLIQFLRRGQAGAVERKERLFDGEAVTLGRSTDQTLHLKDKRVALRHARIAMRGGTPVMSSRAEGGIVVNDMLCREAALQPGDEIRIGSNVLRVFEPPAGADLAFSFELDAEVAAETGGLDPKRLDFWALSWRRSPIGWTLAIATFLLSLLIPASGLMNEGWQERLRSNPLADDGFWLSGPLSSAHHHVGWRCETCHAEPFRRVANAACVDCHAAVGRHFAVDGPVTELDTMRCAGCHAEHNEPATLVRRDDALCTGCHADIAGIAGALATTENVSDFHDAHPKFRLADLEPQRLKFPHDVHLDEAGIDGPEGSKVTMACGDCHEPEADGGRMMPVTMEAHCADCHRLDFDPAFPAATVPHTDATTVLRRLIEYYSRSFLEQYPDPRATANPSRPVRVPGRVTDARERERLLQLARDRAFAVARDLFERRTCHDCHEIAATGDPQDPWKVEPAKLVTAWMPAARFNHARHATSLSECGLCHDAADSKSADDVLMPSIADCRDCHGSGDPHRNPEGLVQSGCILCHGFHDARHGAWAASAQ